MRYYHVNNEAMNITLLTHLLSLLSERYITSLARSSAFEVPKVDIIDFSVGNKIPGRRPLFKHFSLSGMPRMSGDFLAEIFDNLGSDNVVLSLLTIKPFFSPFTQILKTTYFHWVSKVMGTPA